MSGILEIRKNADYANGIVKDIVDSNSSAIDWSPSGVSTQPYLREITAPSFKTIGMGERGNVVDNHFVISFDVSSGYLVIAGNRKGIENHPIMKETFLYDSQPKPWRGLQLLYEGNSSTGTMHYEDPLATRKLQTGFSTIFDRLVGFSKLKEKWDSYGAKTISWDAISAAAYFYAKVLYRMEEERRVGLPVPVVSPLPSGGVEFEWETSYRELIHSFPANASNPLGYLKVDKSTGEEVEEEKSTYDSDFIIGLIVNWLIG